MQLCPANENPFCATFVAASDTSASAATITGVEFPSSRLTRFLCARSRSPQPTPLEPVNVISLTRSSSTRTSPSSEAGPTTTFSQPGGRPGSCSSSASRSADSGVWLAGFRTTAQPAARAGASLCATRLSGKLKGLIAPTMPTGCRSVKASLPVPACAASIGTISPASLRASTAANVYVDIARIASTRAAFIGLPAPSEITRATSSWRRPSAPATLTRISARLCAGIGSRIAASAASSAWRVSRAPAFATRPTTPPENGERTSSHSPVSTHSPPISRRFSASAATMGASLDLVSAWHSDALIIDAVRSPIGKRNGTLSSIRGDELAGQVLDALVRRNDVDPAEIEDVQFGCVTQVGEQGWNIGRMAPLVAGWPDSVCGTTIDRQCGSSMQANFNAATAIWSGQLDVVVSAGAEMMSRVPMGSGGGDLSEKLLDRWQIVPQGVSAEVIARDWHLSREELDAFSLESHRRAARAIDEGRFANEVVPIELTNPHVGVVFAVDETPRRDTSAAALAALRPAFLEDGRVTAGNSSQICDGAAAVLIASEAACSRLGLEPRARFVSFGLAGVDPYRMLHGNPQACAKALARAGLTWDDIAVVEGNEAFASVVLQFAHDAGLEDRWDDINPNGGGISLGHPLGVTGARVTATLLNELERRNARCGIACMCIGFGQAIAGIVERV